MSNREQNVIRLINYLGMKFRKVSSHDRDKDEGQRSAVPMSPTTSKPFTMSTQYKDDKSSSNDAKDVVVDVNNGSNQDEGEVFRTDVEGQNYRTVSW